jgi:uncharacterized protein YkwD
VTKSWMRNLTRLVAAGVVFVSAAHPQSASSERTLFQAVNRERRSSGLPALRWDDALASAARQHAGTMATQHSVAHIFPGEPSLPGRATQAGARFVWLSENVVESTNPLGAHAQFMNSPTHRANILDTDMDTVGIGIVQRDGHLFVVEDFEKAK